MRILVWLFTAVLLSPLYLSAADKQVRQIEIESPRGGEVYVPGQVQRVTLKRQSGLKSAIVELSRDGGQSFERIGTMDFTQNKTLSLNWTVTYPVTANAIMRVRSDDANVPTSGTSGTFIIGALAIDNSQPDGRYVLRSGDIMTGALNLGGNRLIGVPAAAANGDAVPFEQALKVSDASAWGRALMLSSSATAGRTMLVLGDAATKNVGTSAGAVAAGDDSRLSDTRTPTDGSVSPAKLAPGFLLPIASGGTNANNATSARTNLGLGDSATKNVGAASGTVAAGDDSRLSDTRTPSDGSVSTAKLATGFVLPLTNGGTDANNAPSARTNLGLGDAATRNVGTATGTVAAGDDARFGAGVPVGFMILGATSAAPTGFTYTGLTTSTSESPWQGSPHLTTPRFLLAIGVVNNKIYAIGGRDNSPGPNNIFNIVEEFDPSTNMWTTKAPMPTRRCGMAVGVVNNKIYAIGGLNDSTPYLKTVEEYDPALNTWTSRADMPTGRYYLSIGVVNDKLYCVGGFDNSGGGSQKVEEYDPSSNSWATKTDMPTPRGGLAVSVGNSRIYAIGGRVAGSDLTALPNVEGYDPATNTWAVKASLTYPRYLLAAISSNNKIYAIGGYNTDYLQSLNHVEEFDPTLNTWKTKQSMPTARNGLALGVSSSRIYAIGGQTAIEPGGTGYSEVFNASIDSLLYIHRKD